MCQYKLLVYQNYLGNKKESRKRNDIVKVFLCRWPIGCLQCQQHEELCKDRTVT